MTACLYFYKFKFDILMHWSLLPGGKQNLVSLKKKSFFQTKKSQVTLKITQVLADTDISVKSKYRPISSCVYIHMACFMVKERLQS